MIKILLFLQKILDKMYIFISSFSYFFLKLFLKKNLLLSNENITFFKTNDYLKIENFLNADDVKKINNKLEFVDKKKILSEKDILRKKSNKKIIFDKLINNSDIYYDFPKKIFNQYIYIKNPEEIFKSFENKISTKIMHCSQLLNETFVSIEKFEVYKTLANGDHEKINSNWHKDGDLLSSFKILIYLNDVDDNNGALKLLSYDGNEVSLSGKSGTAIFFRAAKLNHSGSVPKKSDRWCLNYKIYPKILLSNKILNKPFNYIRRYNLFLNY